MGESNQQIRTGESAPSDILKRLVSTAEAITLVARDGLRSDGKTVVSVILPDVDLEAGGKQLASLEATTIAPELSLGVMLWDIPTGVSDDQLIFKTVSPFGQGLGEPDSSGVLSR